MERKYPGSKSSASNHKNSNNSKHAILNRTDIRRVKEGNSHKNPGDRQAKY